MSQVKPKVTFYATSDNRHQPYLLNGLMALAADGEIELRVLPRAPRIRDRLVVVGEQFQRVSRPYPWSYRLNIWDPASGRSVRAAVDLQDWKHFLSHGDVTSCDVLFKRSYDPQIASRVSSKFGIAVIPAGMTHSAAVEDHRYGSVLALARLAGRVESLLTSPRRGATALCKMLTKHSPPRSQGGQVAPVTVLSENLMDFAFFQIKCHGDGTWPEAEELNRDRAALIREMRSSLGTRFQGGMYFDGPPRPEFADCVSNLPSTTTEYLKLVAGAAVVISTNGFGGSVPWKLCEYLSLGKCVVAEELAVGLPTPLVSGKDVFFFKSREECARQCLKLLADPATREKMEERARQYYLKHVAPAAAVRRYLEMAIG